MVVMLSKKQKKKKISNILPEELIVHEILSRLPIKELFRFKLVCKKWHNLITHTAINLSSASSFYYFNIGELAISINNDRYQFKFSLPNFVDRYSHIIGSTNGLIYGFCVGFTEIFICNPIIKHVVYVPNPKRLLTIALAYDPYNNPNFGFAIIGMVGMLERFEVYSSKTGEWRKTHEWRVSKNEELWVSSYQCLRDIGAVYNGGKVYWSLVRHIVWFDVEKDVAGIVPYPDHDNNNNLVFLDPSENCFYFEIGVCNENGNGGELSYSKMTKEGDIEIWLLRKLNNNSGRRRGDHQCNDEFEWVKRHNVILRGTIVEAFERRRSIIYPLPYLGGGVVWFWMEIKYELKKGKLFSVNLRTQELKLINHDNLNLSAWPFTPTLLPCPT